MYQNRTEEQVYLDMYRIKHNFYLFQHLSSNVDQNFVEYPTNIQMSLTYHYQEK
jgi:hypothetical protein